MNKINTFLTLFLFSVLLFSCSSQKEADNKVQQEEVETQVVTGVIMVAGNEPFAKLSVMVNDTTSYILNSSKEIAEELKMNQGTKYSITYTENSTEKNTIDVVKIEKKNK